VLRGVTTQSVLIGYQLVRRKDDSDRSPTTPYQPVVFSDSAVSQGDWISVHYAPQRTQLSNAHLQAATSPGHAMTA